VKRRLPSKAAVREKVGSELKELLVLTAYLFVVFGAIFFYKSAILRAEGVDWAPLSFALIKAVLAAKFILIGKAMHLGERHKAKPLIWETLQKSLVFLAFVAVLTVIEEAFVGVLHGRSLWQSVSEIGGGTPEQLIATLVIIFLVLLPLFAFGALSDVMGEKALFGVFFLRRVKFEPVKGRERE
jgi:hypothetical protein